VIKGSGGVLALVAGEVGDPAAAGPCIRCASCVGACPIGLVPLEMAALIRAGEFEAAAAIGLTDCIGCGTCAYVCPSRIPLVQFFNHAKGELAAQSRGKARQVSIRELAEARALRMEREARDKAEAAARRKAERERARAEALAKAVPTPARSDSTEEAPA
jgi:electron transport complex protein RnfC